MADQAAAAAAVVAIVVGGLVLVARDDDPNEQIPAATTVDPGVGGSRPRTLPEDSSTPMSPTTPTGR